MSKYCAYCAGLYLSISALSGEAVSASIFLDILADQLFYVPHFTGHGLKLTDDILVGREIQSHHNACSLLAIKLYACPVLRFA